MANSLEIDAVTVWSLLSTVAILGVAYGASVKLLAPSTSRTLRIFFIWHAFDALIHTILEGGFLYNCFFSSTARPAPGPRASLAGTIASGASAYLSPDVYLFGDADRLYGSLYGTNPLAALWREYAKADARWGGSDLTVISLELLTVGIGAPLATWVCECIRSNRRDMWFWMMVLATGELYGGFMTFAPEWLSGNPNLDSENALHLWVYLFFFNMLWVVIPFWILYEGYQVHFARGASTPSYGRAKKRR